MAQTSEGARKTAAKRAGISIDEYASRETAGEKWCSLCRQWHPKSEFRADNSRWDLLYPSCAKSVNSRARKHYRKRPRPKKGRRFVAARPQDRKQARRRVNYLVEAGVFPPPNDKPCTDCGHIWKLGGRRHEYDHYLGYAPEHHETVEIVCTKCHRQRAIDYGEI